MKARQLVNVVTRRGSTYSLSRIKPNEKLFYPSIEEAAAAPKRKKMQTISRMPAPKFRLEAYRLDDMRLDFLPLYDGRGSGGDSAILSVDSAGNTVLCDSDARSVQPVPDLGEPKGASPISFCIPNQGGALALYVLDRLPAGHNSRNFEALLVYGENRREWRRLPPPPYVNDPAYDCAPIQSPMPCLTVAPPSAYRALGPSAPTASTRLAGSGQRLGAALPRPGRACP
ncbi:unnamed protein product [Alopecurus aequalis]